MWKSAAYAGGRGAGKRAGEQAKAEWVSAPLWNAPTYDPAHLAYGGGGLSTRTQGVWPSRYMNSRKFAKRREAEMHFSTAVKRMLFSIHFTFLLSRADEGQRCVKIVGIACSPIFTGDHYRS